MSDDPYAKAKMIALRRTTLPDGEEDITADDLFNFVKWKLCTARNKLWLDPIWGDYTPEEMMVEYFAIMFTENPTMAEEFANKVRGVSEATLEAFDRLEKKLLQDVSPEGEFTESF